MKISKLSNRSIAVILLAMVFQVQASPTENEYIKCEKMAVKHLESCLENQNRPARDYKCWGGSNSTYRACEKSIKQAHNKHVQEEKKAATEKLLR